MRQSSALLLVLSFSINVLFAYFFITHHHHEKNKTSVVKSVQSSEKGMRKVALLTPISHPSLEKIQEGFVKTLTYLGQEENVKYDVTIYNANGSPVLMRSQVEDIIQKKFDLVFTVGATASQMAKEVVVKKQSTMPIVFSAVNSPEKLNLIGASENSFKANITGVAESRNLQLQVDLLTFLIPSAKRALLVYNPTEGGGLLEHDKIELAAICEKKSIIFTSLEVFSQSEIYSKTASSLSEVDVVIVLKDNTVVSGIDALIKLCNQHKVVLYTSDLDSVDKGATFGFGVTEFDFGKEGAFKAHKILFQNIATNSIAVTPASDFKLKFNEEAMTRHGFIMRPELAFLIRSSTTVK